MQRGQYTGLVVALALIPEAISFSIIAGVDPKVGLYASFSIAIIISIAGGRPGMQVCRQQAGHPDRRGAAQALDFGTLDPTTRPYYELYAGFIGHYR